MPEATNSNSFNVTRKNKSITVQNKAVDRLPPGRRLEPLVPVIQASRENKRQGNATVVYGQDADMTASGTESKEYLPGQEARTNNSTTIARSGS